MPTFTLDRCSQPGQVPNSWYTIDVLLPVVDNEPLSHVIVRFGSFRKSLVSPGLAARLNLLPTPSGFCGTLAICSHFEGDLVSHVSSSFFVNFGKASSERAGAFYMHLRLDDLRPTFDVRVVSPHCADGMDRSFLTLSPLEGDAGCHQVPIRF